MCERVCSFPQQTQRARLILWQVPLVTDLKRKRKFFLEVEHSMKERFSRLKMFCLKIETVSHCRYFCQEFFKGRPNHRYQELTTRSEQKPFPSSKNSHFLNEANCKIFLMKIRFICTTMTKSFSCQPHSASL